jgi:predicted Zn-dependent peptidase
MTFSEYYVRDALDTLNAAEAAVNVDMSIDELIKACATIKRARKELAKRQQFKGNENDYTSSFTQQYDDVLRHFDYVTTLYVKDAEPLAALITALDAVKRANHNVRKAYLMVEKWRRCNER